MLTTICTELLWIYKCNFMPIPCVLGSGTSVLFLTYNTIERELARVSERENKIPQNRKINPADLFFAHDTHTHTHRPSTCLVKATLISGEELQEYYEVAEFKGCRKRRDKPEKLIFLQHSRHKVKLPKKRKKQLPLQNNSVWTSADSCIHRNQQHTKPE